MVTRRGILFGAFIALSLLGACRDVPIDGDTGVVVHPIDTTGTPVRDTCRDCVKHRERMPARMMTYRFWKKGSGPGPAFRLDSIDLGISLSDFNVTRNGNGSMNIQMALNTEVPRLQERGSLPAYWGVRELFVNIPGVEVDANGHCEKLTLEKNPTEDSLKPGMTMEYSYYNKRSIEVATGDRNESGKVSRGWFEITHVDTAGRYVDARLEAVFHLPNEIHQEVGPGKLERIDFVGLDIIFRIGLNQ
jgi:hypothetical protein